MPSCTAIIVAAGRGSRFGGDRPKQYTELAGVPLLRYALQAFDRHSAVNMVVPVIHPDDRGLFDEAAEGLDVLDPVTGGATRQESVLRGLETLTLNAPETVLIHDGARPNPGEGVIDRVLAALQGGVSGAIPTLPVQETLKRLDGTKIVLETVNRANVVRAQTPQGFLFSPLLNAHREHAHKTMTDDAAVLEQSGHAVTTVDGHSSNIKVTNRQDLERIADALFEVRTGSGFDVHRFGPGDGLVLGGIHIPFNRGLIGHSDADVVLHAATDAILGALADGDIGVHFPPLDADYKDASSHLFLKFAMDRLCERLGSLLHLDITIICEQPKVLPFREQMRATISEIAGVSLNRISVKATTSEGLGFTGRGEGIACQALATIRVVPLS